MENMKRLEKFRRKAAARAEAAIRQYEKAIQAKFFYARKIEKINRQKNPHGIWADLDAIRKGVERLAGRRREVQFTS